MTPKPSRPNWSTTDGTPAPLGVTYVKDTDKDNDQWNFALYSQYATGVTLLLYGDDATTLVKAYGFQLPKNKTSRIWHCRWPVDRRAKYYGYHVDGPFDPSHGQRFDKEKVLLDPYARSVYFPPGFSRAAASRPGPNEGKAPLGMLPRPEEKPFVWGEDEKRPHHEYDAIIYEMHVKGFTARKNSGVRWPGTYSGVTQKAEYLKDLGVTVVELLPVCQYDPSEGNYWGYTPMNFFSPHHCYAYAKTAAADEFREMVKTLHANDIEVVLDVVYNHTTERDQTGPDYSFRGIDNSTYYLLNPKDMAQYLDYSGTGNSLQCANSAVRKLILDSMRFWVKEMHVDGFRFDLASIFERNSDGTLNLDDPPLIAEISGDPEFKNIRLSAEPWGGDYELGPKFAGTTWHQWNANFRDEVRRFVKSDYGMVQPLMKRLYGSSDLFLAEHAYRPWQSINYICCHDGFNLKDLVTYNQKHNEKNGENNTDGENNNYSWNCGNPGDDAEGDGNIAKYDYLAPRRKKQIKNFCTLLFLANGTPMFCMGDEFMNTQKGNNNPYSQDDETTWLDWNLESKNKDIFQFFQKMIAFRRDHPSIARSTYWGEDVTWYLCAFKDDPELSNAPLDLVYGVKGDPNLSGASYTLAYCLHGSAVGDKEDLYVMINAYWKEVTFEVQEGEAKEWRKVIDTAADADLQPINGLSCRVDERSIVVLVRDSKGGAPIADATSAETDAGVADPSPPHEET